MFNPIARRSTARALGQGRSLTQGTPIYHIFNRQLRGGAAVEAIHLSLNFQQKMDCFAALALTTKSGEEQEFPGLILYQ